MKQNKLKVALASVASVALSASLLTACDPPLSPLLVPTVLGYNTPGVDFSITVQAIEGGEDDNSATCTVQDGNPDYAGPDPIPMEFESAGANSTTNYKGVIPGWDTGDNTVSPLKYEANGQAVSQIVCTVSNQSGSTTQPVGFLYIIDGLALLDNLAGDFDETRMAAADNGAHNIRLTLVNDDIASNIAGAEYSFDGTNSPNALPAGLSIDKDSGDLIGTATDTDAGLYQFYLSVDNVFPGALDGSNGSPLIDLTVVAGDDADGDGEAYTTDCDDEDISVFTGSGC